LALDGGNSVKVAIKPAISDLCSPLQKSKEGLCSNHIKYVSFNEFHTSHILY